MSARARRFRDTISAVGLIVLAGTSGTAQAQTAPQITYQLSIQNTTITGPGAPLYFKLTATNTGSTSISYWVQPGLAVTDSKNQTTYIRMTRGPGSSQSTSFPAGQTIYLAGDANDYEVSQAFSDGYPNGQYTLQYCSGPVDGQYICSNTVVVTVTP